MNKPKAIGYCDLIMLVALYRVGAVSNGVLRHVAQTLPLLFPIAMGLRGHEIAKWALLPCSLIWLFLLDWVNVASGHCTTRLEVMLPLVVGAASGNCSENAIYRLLARGSETPVAWRMINRRIDRSGCYRGTNFCGRQLRISAV